MATKARCTVRNAQFMLVKVLLRHNIILRPNFKCQNWILNAQKQYSAPVWMSKYDFGCQNTIFALRSNVKIGFWMTKKTIFGSISNVKIGFWMSKYAIRSLFECQNRILNVKWDIRSLLECQNRILNVKMRYSAPVRMSKYDFECQNTIFRLVRMSK